MRLLVRVCDAGGSNPIVIEQADDINVFESVNSSDEGGSFTMPANDPKCADVDYTKWWEIWDADTNERLNYGPIHEITERNETWAISGPGRSQLLEDLIMTKYTFYYPINRMLDDLRYENVAAEPRTTTRVYGQANQPAFPGDDKYYGLSRKTKDNAIDDVIVPTISDKRLPTFHTTDSFWSGTGTADGITINLGQVVPISRVHLLFPWWGGYKRFTNRTYDFQLQYSNDFESPFTTAVTKAPNYTVTGDRYGGFFYYFRASGDSPVGYEPLAEQIDDEPIEAKLWRVNITDTHGWHSHQLVGQPPTEGLDEDCEPPPVGSGGAPGAINHKELEPANDCHASLVEFGAYQEIIGKDQISNLVYQQVDGSSNQITYYHEYGDEEVAAGTKTVKSYNDGDGNRTMTKYEPGSFFKRIRFSWAGSGSAFTKFFASDPDGSMTSSVMAVVDQNNSLVYRSLLASGTKDLKLPAYTQHIMIKGATGVNIINTDCWLGEANPFSTDNTIHTSVHANDTATLHFRGITLKLFVTTPTGKQGGHVQLMLREKQSDGTWGGWDVLEEDLEIPDNVDNYLLYEITQEDNLLVEGGIYEFRVKNLGGYVGLDAFAGYWEASWNDYNEDHERILYSDEAGEWKQIYDGRFSGGTMNKTNKFGAHAQFAFDGDRVQIFMAKGPNFGKATIYISHGDQYGQNLLEIPGIGDKLEVDTGEHDGSPLTHYIPRWLAFDSNDYWPNGMPWSGYNIHIRHLDDSTYTARINQATDALFDQECIDCNSERDAEIPKFIYIDGVSAHTTSGLSAKFNNETHLSILKSVSEAILHEWRITERGLYVRPRIGEDTDVIIKESSQALVNFNITRDVSKVATLLYATGAQIDGLPLFTITEDKTNKAIMGRTISRSESFSNLADYFQLVGISRVKLTENRTPEDRVNLTYFGTPNVSLGDSFILSTKRHREGQRVRLMKLSRSQSHNNGTVYEMECIKWPPNS